MPSGPDPAVVAALVAAQEASREYLNEAAVSYAQQAAATYAEWYAMDTVTDWAAGLASNIQNFLAPLAGMTGAYLATMIGELNGEWYDVQPETVDVAKLRRGDTTHAQAYERVASTYRYQQSLHDKAAVAIATAPKPQPPKLMLPMSAAVARAASVANRDVQLVVSQQSQQALVAAKDRGLVIGWRRMVHPELSRDGTCGLCVAASTRLYHVEDLMPIHDHCHCLPIPVTADHDPGLDLDRKGFAQLYGAAGDTTAAALKKTRYVINEHGELGPVLAPAGAKQRTPGQVARDTKTPHPMAEQRKQAKLRDLRDSLSRSLPRLDQLVDDDPAKWTDYRQTIRDRAKELDSQLAAA